ncbi:MAG TPA: NTP transferase domain-containing protein [bacterium]|nr:NTP transferase domain-containing protein [bacterium]HPP12514.1 NTP transferase domain-containing protein [bacterium]
MITPGLGEKGKRLAVVILAAGRGKRLGGKNQKVVHDLMGRPLLSYLLPTVKSLFPERIIIVVGFKKEQIFSWIHDAAVEYVEQPEPKGTGHAVACTEKILGSYRGNILVLCGDVPFLSQHTLLKMINLHQEEGNVATVLTTIMEKPTGYGRILRNGSDVIAIVEEINATPEQRAIKEINAGVYLFRSVELFQTLPEVLPDPRKGEQYLTDVVGLLAVKGYRVGSYQTACPEEVLGINTEDDLRKAEQWLKERKVRLNQEVVEKQS